MLLISDTEFMCEVHPFIDTYNSIKQVPVVTAATAYDDLDTGETTILVFPQILWFGRSMKDSLICP